jgi:hypothetical protein
VAPAPWTSARDSIARHAALRLNRATRPNAWAHQPGRRCSSDAWEDCYRAVSWPCAIWFVLRNENDNGQDDITKPKAGSWPWRRALGQAFCHDQRTWEEARIIRLAKAILCVPPDTGWRASHAISLGCSLTGACSMVIRLPLFGRLPLALFGLLVAVET